MSSEFEMRNVIEHAAASMRKAADNHIGVPDDILMSMAYASGVLDLLASYLKVEDKPPPNDHRPARPTDPGEMFSRDAAIVEAVGKGKTKAAVAREFGLSHRRIGQIIEAAETK